MDSEIVKVSDARVQSLGLKFDFITQSDKLIIEALCSKDNQKYVGQIAANPYVDFQDVIELLKEGQFKTLINNEEILKIKAGAVPIQLFPKSKSQIKELKDALKKSLEKQEQMEAVINSQKIKLDAHQNMINDLRTTVQEMKSSPKVPVTMMEEMNKQLNQKIYQLSDNVKSETYALKSKQQQFSQASQETQRKIKQILVSITQIKEEVNLNKESLKVSDTKIDELKQQLKIITNDLMKEVTDLKTANNNQQTKIDQLNKSLSIKIEENKTISDNHEKTLKQLVNSNKKLESLEVNFENVKVDLKKINNKLQKINPLIKKLEQEQQKRKIIESFKWSQQLKSKNITINGKVVSLTKQTDYWQFCLLNASFSNTLNAKQSWAIKINKITGGIQLGVCLKSKMQKYNFNSQNINWRETGHGLYLIDSGGWCWSHSQKEFNHVWNKSFKFAVDDVIFIEYDGVNNKLRFNKNRVEYFEMPIIAPPQNDSYHPCVALANKNQQVELIEVIENKQ